MNALIIFYKNPLFGKVKTRLAATVGNSAAMEIYLNLVEHTVHISTEVDVQKIVFYSQYIEKEDVWNDDLFYKEVQEGADLGNRMCLAFKQTFLKKFDKIVCIGCDCIELSSVIIKEAFDKLNDSDVVIGPAMDGGYYLIGMKRLHSCLFENIAWSTDTVFSTTLDRCREANLTFTHLSQLTDIDTEKDWTQWQALHQANEIL